MTEIETQLLTATPNTTSSLFVVGSNHSSISTTQAISLAPMKHDISSFIVAPSDHAYLRNTIQNLKEGEEISGVVLGSIPALPKYTFETNSSNFSEIPAPHNEQDAIISSALPQTFTEAAVNETMVNGTKADEPVRSTLISVPRETDHSGVECLESTGTVGYTIIEEETKFSDQPERKVLLSIENTVGSEPVRDVDATAPAPSSNGSLTTKNGGPATELRDASHTNTEPTTSLPLAPIPDVKPHTSPVIPEATTPTGTAADFYRIDTLAWEHFASVAGSNLTNWVNAYYNCGPAPVPKTTGVNDADKSTIVEPLHVDVLVYGREDEIRRGKDGKTLPAHTEESTGKLQPRISLFDRSEYPAPWPLIPYSQRACQYLEYQIPHGSLPKTLIVHDPWNLLAVDSSNEHGRAKRKEPYGSWIEREDIIHTYDLKLTPEVQARVKDDDDSKITGSSTVAKDSLGEEPKEEEEIFMTSEETGTGVKLTIDGTQRHPPGFLFYPENATLGPIYPPIFVIFDLPSQGSQPVDPSPSTIDKAHLYISPRDWIGYGNHSCVVEVELELPRSAIIRPSHTDYRPRICVSCVKNDLRAKLESLDGQNGERISERWKEKRATWKRTFLPDNSGDPTKGRYISYITGPLRPIRITLRPHDYNAKQCQYAYPSPPSTRVRVMAKLSNIDDDHLDREAANYQAFPQHMFEHRTDTYQLPNDDDAVPMGAVVPQFYGYYVPRGRNTDGVEDDCYHQKHGQYLSRILLMEDCGRQISLDALTSHEMKICASLVARFHDAGWSHESVYRRNFVQQPGPLSIRLSQRTGRIFRLVDFGRSFHNESGIPSPSGCANWKASREIDEEDTEKIFGIDITREADDVDNE